MDLPLEGVDIEPHLCHEALAVVRADGGVLVVRLDVLGLQPLVQHRLGVLHRPVAVDAWKKYKSQEIKVDLSNISILTLFSTYPR